MAYDDISFEPGSPGPSSSIYHTVTELTHTPRPPQIPQVLTHDEMSAVRRIAQSREQHHVLTAAPIWA